MWKRENRNDIECRNELLDVVDAMHFLLVRIHWCGVSHLSISFVILVRNSVWFSFGRLRLTVRTNKLRCTFRCAPFSSATKTLCAQLSLFFARHFIGMFSSSLSLDLISKVFQNIFSAHRQPLHAAITSHSPCKVHAEDVINEFSHRPYSVLAQKQTNNFLFGPIA